MEKTRLKKKTNSNDFFLLEIDKRREKTLLYKLLEKFLKETQFTKDGTITIDNFSSCKNLKQKISNFLFSLILNTRSEEK
jgi:hypothetical protein